MQIRFDLDDSSFTVTLGDGPAARSLAAQLPLTLTLRDFHRTEKVADLPSRLDTRGEPSGTSAEAGDLTYYSPWGNLAFFYRGFGYADGLVALGKIDGDPSVLKSIREGQEATVTVVG